MSDAVETGTDCLVSVLCIRIGHYGAIQMLYYYYYYFWFVCHWH